MPKYFKKEEQQPIKGYDYRRDMIIGYPAIRRQREEMAKVLARVFPDSKIRRYEDKACAETSPLMVDMAD